MTRLITKAEWVAMMHHGYTSVRNGQRFILTIDKATGATVLEPVEVAEQGWWHDDGLLSAADELDRR